MLRDFLDSDVFITEHLLLRHGPLSLSVQLSTSCYHDPPLRISCNTASWCFSDVVHCGLKIEDLDLSKIAKSQVSSKI